LATTWKNRSAWSGRYPISSTLDLVLHHGTVVQITGESCRLKDKRRAGIMAQPKAREAAIQ
jgi:DNA replication protein DnaC